MKNKEKTDKEKRSKEAEFNFPFGDFKNISEMMSKCCERKEVAFNCCSMMEGMMNGKSSKSEQENKNK